MITTLSRREFLGRSAAAAGLALASSAPLLHAQDAADNAGLDFPIMDLHVHLDGSTLDRVLALPQVRGIKLGIVEHAGTKENVYPRILSDDAELQAQLDLLAGQAVFRGVQAEWLDWMRCFSPEMAAKLDYVLTDAMTFPGKDGRRVKLWEADAPQRVDMSDKETFMDRFVDWHVEIMAKEPFDIFANVSWLPAPLAEDYDHYWTEARVEKLVTAAVKYDVALEISSSFKVPRLPFLKIAKAAGVKFSFGSNGRYPDMGKLDYSIAMAKELGLTKADMFTPAPDGQKAVQRRKWA
jgi:histidinol phosphatase-like PHP family hydrolase